LGLAEENMGRHNVAKPEVS